MFTAVNCEQSNRISNVMSRLLIVNLLVKKSKSLWHNLLMMSPSIGFLHTDCWGFKNICNNMYLTEVLYLSVKFYFSCMHAKHILYWQVYKSVHMFHTYCQFNAYMYMVFDHWGNLIMAWLKPYTWNMCTCTGLNWYNQTLLSLYGTPVTEYSIFFM